MKEHPILFSGPLVKALLAGTKTQTRRIAATRLEGETTADGVTTMGYEPDRSKGWGRVRAGDRLWVRESVRRDGEPEGEERWCPSVFMADGSLTKADCWPWKNKALPAIHMPRGLCRIVLEVESVHLERLQDISEEDAKAEGVEPAHTQESWSCMTGDGRQFDCFGEPDQEMRDEDNIIAVVHQPERELLNARGVFRNLWDSINGKRPGCSWESNCWVWVVSFRRLP